MIYFPLIISPNRNELITSRMAMYLFVSFHQTNQWKVNHHMKKSLIGKLLLCNRWKVKSSATKDINLFEKNPIQTDNNQWKVNRALA